jgi:hypothetical protein
MLLVGETATGGIHSAALAAALDLALQWNRPFTPQADDSLWNVGAVRILGPYYSGSAPSLALALHDAAARHRLPAGARAWFDLVSGSATSTTNPRILEQPGLATFRATARSDPEALRAIAHYLGRTNRSWQCGLHIGLLVEANTAWGSNVLNPGGATAPVGQARGVDARAVSACETCLADPDGYDRNRDIRRESLPCAVVAHFPLHISRLRAQLQESAKATSARPTPRTSEIALNLSEKVPPVDRVPAETPELTAAAVETMVAGLFDVLNDRQITAIGVLATDKRDHVYLAQEIALHRPNVLPFALESSLLYLHPDAVGFVRGTIIASTYPLNPRTQQWTQSSTRESQQFGTSQAQGMFNALAVLLRHPEITVDYNSPRAPSERRLADPDQGLCGRGNPRIDKECSPPIWLSVVGRGTLLPLAISEGAGCTSSSSGERYVFCRPRDAVTREDAFLDEYVSARHLPFVGTIALLLFLIGVQIWAYRWTAERIAAYDNSTWSPDDQWKRAFESWRRAASGEQYTQPEPACSVECTAGLAAMRGATVVLVLWALRTGVIYASNGLGIPVEYSQRGVWIIASCALTYILWHVIQAFWSGARRARITVERGAVLVFTASVFVLVAALTPPFANWHLARVMVAVCPLAMAVAVFGDRLVRNCIDHERDALIRWRRLVALLGVGALMALLADIVVDHWQPVEALFYADRAINVRSFVSPTACVVAVCVALFWWGIWNVHRAYLMLLPENAVGMGALLEATSRRAAIDPKNIFGSVEQGMGWGVVPVTLAVLLALFFGRSYLGTIDGRAFSAFLLLGPLCVVATIGHTLAHSVRLGLYTIRLLRTLAQHSQVDAFKAVGVSPFSWSISFREPRLHQLAPMLASMDKAAQLLVQFPVTSEIGEPDKRLGTEISDTLKALRDRHRSQCVSTLLWRCDWQALDGIIRKFVSVLEATRWRADFDAARCRGPVRRALEELQHVVFFHAAIVLRDLLTRLVSGFTIVFGALLLLLAAHLLYTFQGRVYWLSLDTGAIILTSLLGMRLLIPLERDTVLSYIWKTTPGNISLFGGLTWRMAAYAVISLGTVFIVFFPELAGHLRDWLPSVQTTLP